MFFSKKDIGIQYMRIYNINRYQYKGDSIMVVTTLNGQWKVSGVDKDGMPISFPAKIPGTVHTAMMECGLINDLYYGDNAEKYKWIEYSHWTFEREFDVCKYSDTKRLELEFSGLDTYATVYLNGVEILKADDMHLAYTVDVTDLAHNGINTLKIDFAPTKEYADKAEMPVIRGAFAQDRFFIRRMQCTYGWDWVRRFVTVGIWRDVTLYRDRTVKIQCLKASLKGMIGKDANMELFINTDVLKKEFHDTYIKRGQHYSTAPMAHITVKDPDGNVIYKENKLIREEDMYDYVTVKNAKLWYPAGYGEQPLYDFEVAVSNGFGEVITEKSIKFGIRDVQIVEEFDAPNSKEEKIAKAQFEKFFSDNEIQPNDCASFTLYVNGVKIFCKGGNWVPADPFPGNVSEEKYEELIRTFAKGNMNMFRVWGGGIFEEDIFYSLCDKYGIMIQQDFLSACGRYPYDDEDLEGDLPYEAYVSDQMKREAEYNIKRIMYHPSIMWWNGDNENIMWWNDDFINNARRISLGINRPIVKRLDPERRYFASSPSLGSVNNVPSRGFHHATGFCDRFMDPIVNTDMDNYMEVFEGALSRFANETPVIGGMGMCNLKRFMSESDMAIGEKEIFDYHTPNPPALTFKKHSLFTRIDLGGEKIFGEFKSTEDRIYKQCLVGYEWARSVTEYYRRNKWFASGLLFWMYNDCWPGLGWSMVDYYLTPKHTYYAMKRTCKPLISTIHINDGKAVVTVCNDSLIKYDIKGKLYIVNNDKGITKAIDFDGSIDKNISKEVFTYDVSDITFDGDNVIICDIISGDITDRSFYLGVKPAKLNFKKAKVKMEIKGDKVALKTDKTAFFVALDGEYNFSENVIMLLPDEETTITMEKSYKADTEDITLMWLNK